MKSLIESKKLKKARVFNEIAKWITRIAGRPVMSISAFAIILLWAFSGPLFNFSDTWQLVINTGTTIITFLMVFLIQNTQNRDTEAMQIKLDELIRAVGGAQNTVLDLEEMDESELDRIRAQYQELAEKARVKLEQSNSKKSAAKAKKKR